MKKQFMIALYAATALSAVSIPQAGWAQTAAADTAADTKADDTSVITVTARRRAESIVDVPLAITVVTSEKLDRLNLKSTRDIANFTPGLEFSDFTQGNSRNDRGGNRTIIFRGLNLAGIGGGVQQAASMFLDGALVLGNEIPGSLDIGAVEVLRGPQNVYFGRSTMTGAISYRTKAIPKELAIEANLELAQRKTGRVEASIAGPIVQDVLGFRFTGLYETNDGFVTNAYNPNGPDLGARSRRSLSATLDFTPTSALEIKGYANYFEDEDGPSATVNIFPDASYGGAGASTTVQGGTLVALGTVTNCIRPGASRATICGRVPDVSRAVAYSRTDIPAEYANLLFDYTPYIKAEHFKHMAGLQRHALNTHAVVNLQISDYLKLQAITGYHVTTVVQDIDGAQQPATATSGFNPFFFGLSNKTKDFSQEIRLSSDPERAFSWTVGGNYAYVSNINQAWNLTTTTAANPSFPATPAGTFNGAGGVFNPGLNRSKTYGVFAGGYLKLLDNRLTISAEGRYQSDQRFAETLDKLTMATVVTSGPAATNGVFIKTFKSFSPRVSIDYDIGGGRKIYASYAKGGRPGGFNSSLQSFLDPNNSRYGGPTPCGCYAATVAQITQLFGVIDPGYKEETLSIGELGFKGYLPNNKGYFDLNAYYGIVSNQQVTQAQVINTLSPPTTLSIVVNTGKTEIYGLEFTGNYNFTPEISLDTTFAWNYTRRKQYIDNTAGTIALYGISDFSGLHLPFSPIISGSAVLSYEQRTSDEWSPFGNVALVYRGKQYADIGNLAYIPGRAVVDLRAGAKNGRFRFEAYVSNVFQNRTYPGGNVAAEFGINQVNGLRSSNTGFFGAYAEPRTFGIRASAKF